MPATLKGVPPAEAAKYLKTGFCDEWFHDLDDNVCVNLAFDDTPGEWYSGQTWCYTSVGCNLPSAIKVDEMAVHAKIKFCGAGDATLSSMSVSDIINYKLFHDLDFGLTIKLSYPVEHVFKWSDFKNKTLEAFCNYTNTTDRKKRMPLEEKMPRNLALEDKVLKPIMTKVRKSAGGVVVPEPDDNTVFGVITPFAIYEVTATAASLGEAHAHPESETEVTCLCGAC